MFRSLTLSVFLAALLLAGGCANAPVQAMSDTRQAIQAAEAAGAEAAAPAQLAAARDGLKRAEDLLRVRDYRAATREAVNARDRAKEALAATNAAATPH
jgi:Domain of unknown function (DUF4398)